MNQNNFQYLTRGIQDLWQVIKTKKVYLTLIFLLQIISISLFSYIIIVASIVIAGDLQNLTGPLAALDLENPNLTEQQILVQGAKMYAAYEILADNVIKYVLMAILVFFTIPGFLWSLSQMAVENLGTVKIASLSLKESTIKLIKRFFIHYKTYLSITSILFLPFALATFLIGQVMLKSEVVAFTNAAQVFTGIAVILAFLCLAALSVATTNSWRTHLQMTKQLLSSHFQHFFLTCIVVAIPISASVYFLHNATLIREDFTLMVIAAVLTILSVIAARLLLILTTKHLLSEGATK